MKTRLTIFTLFVTWISYSQAYVQMDAGYNGNEIPFSISGMYEFKMIAGRINYLEQVEKDVWAIQAGIIPIWDHTTRVVIWLGQEFRPNAENKVSIELWQQVNPGIFITGGVGTAADRTYGHLGLTLQIVKIKEKKPKRFY